MGQAQSSDERSARRLIRRYTAQRNWLLVEILFNALGEILCREAWEREQADANPQAPSAG